MQRQEQKRAGLSPLEVVASLLCVLYGAGFFFLAHPLEELGLKQVYIRTVQGVGIGFFLVALVGLMRLRTITMACQVLVAIAWLILIPIGFLIDQLFGSEGHLVTLWVSGIGICLALLHFFFARQFDQRTQE